MTSARVEGSGRGLRGLQRVTDAALSHLSLDDLLQELLERVTEVIEVDTVAILLLSDDGRALEPRAAKGLEEEVERGVRIPVGQGFAGRIAAEGRPVIVDDVEQAELVNPLFREKGLHTLLGVPLLVEGQSLGVLHVGRLESRPFSADEANLLQHVGDRAAMAISHAHLYDAERQARELAEASLERLARLQRITDAALAHLALDDLLDELLQRMKEILHVDTAAILLLEDDGRTLEARAAKGLEEWLERGFRIPVGRGFAGRIASQRRAVVIDDVDQADIRDPLLRDRGLRSLMGVPLLVSGEVLGVLHVGSLESRNFSHEDADLLQLAADRSAMAIRAARRFEQEHEVAKTLQSSLLPAALPEMPGVTVGARYLPAGVGAQLGGDWYDAFQLPDGKLGLVIGDVVGHGLSAAALMGQLRNAVRAYALEGAAPGDVAERINRLLRELERGRSATFLYAVLDPDCDEVVIASAAHPPPLLAPADGEPRFVELPASVPLGVTRRPSYTEVTDKLGTGATLLLYTDGLVERRGEDLQQGLSRLQQVAANPPEDPQELCDMLQEEMLGHTASADDTALLAVRSMALDERLRMLLPAEPESAATFRRVLGRWLSQAGAASAESDEIKLACSEACANAIEHAYSPARAVFEVEAVRDDGDVTVTVRDWGQWRAQRGEFRGRGLLLMKGLMDNVDVRQTPHGSTVRLTRKLGRQAVA
jgi:serine phosphatase RsbU (regulator of sigma subunit)/anti-sigma regulatory factor (Ser/Thr protein kinase)/putative methionine-R-sulfoxide reductase with GAF domain